MKRFEAVALLILFAATIALSFSVMDLRQQVNEAQEKAREIEKSNTIVLNSCRMVAEMIREGGMHK